MDALFEGLVDRLTTSGRLADSTLLKIIHSAMLDAHKRTISEGTRALVRLHHNARFHELSIMMLECCARVVREEAEKEFSEGRYEFERALESLEEQRGLMRRKLEDLEGIIAENDSGLKREKLDEVVIKQKQQSFNEKQYVENDSTLERDDLLMIDTLETSIERELLRFETKLETERGTFPGNLHELKRNSVDNVIVLENEGVNQLHRTDFFEEMVSDVNVLKEDVKVSFQKMNVSKGLFDANLEENQLRMEMERDISNLLMKSLIQEANCNNCKLDSSSKLAEETSEEAEVLRDDIEKVVISSAINGWINEMNSIAIYNSLKEDIGSVLFGEIIRDLTMFSSSGEQVTEIEHSLNGEINCFVSSEIMKDLAEHISVTINNKVLEEIDASSSKLLEKFLDVETMISSKTDANNKRLEELNLQLDFLKEEVFLLKKKELLYRNAFHRRCYNLQTAEAEVDLLGDEVELLLSLIKKSYEVLDRHLPELQYHPEVMEIVHLLKDEVEAEWQQ